MENIHERIEISVMKKFRSVSCRKCPKNISVKSAIDIIAFFIYTMIFIIMLCENPSIAVIIIQSFVVLLWVFTCIRDRRNDRMAIDKYIETLHPTVVHEN